MFNLPELYKQAKQTWIDRRYGSAANVNPANLPGPSDTDVLAADLRLRRRMAMAKGSASTVMTGGLGGKEARITLPSLVGV